MRSYVLAAVLFALAVGVSARSLRQDASMGTSAAAPNATTGASATAPSYPMFSEALMAANTTPAANLSTLMAALTATGLDLSNVTNVTILAPNNEAFAKRLPALGLTPAQLLAPENNSTLISILSYHVIPGIYTSANLTDDANVTTLQSSNLTVEVDNTTMPANITFSEGPMATYGADVVVPDIVAGGTVVHVIDDVLVPAAVVEALAANATAGGAMAGGVMNATAGTAASGIAAP